MSTKVSNFLNPSYPLEVYETPEEASRVVEQAEEILEEEYGIDPDNPDSIISAINSVFFFGSDLIQAADQVYWNGADSEAVYIAAHFEEAIESLEKAEKMLEEEKDGL